MEYIVDGGANPHPSPKKQKPEARREEVRSIVALQELEARIRQECVKSRGIREAQRTSLPRTQREMTTSQISLWTCFLRIFLEEDASSRCESVWTRRW